MIRCNERGSVQFHLNGPEGDTHIKVVPSMLQDELSGVWFVLTVVHIHLELISLDEARTMIQ